MMPLQDALIDKYRSCVFDSPGYCWSDTGKVPYVRSEQTDLVAQMLERSGEKGPFIMMGHSDGGQLSRALYVRHPELVAGIVLLDSVNTQWYTVTFNLTGQNFLADASNVGLVSTVDTVRAFAAVGVQRLFQRPNDFPAQYQLAVGWTWWQTRNWNSQYWGVRGGSGEFAKNWDYNGKLICIQRKMLAHDPNLILF
jgi:pimeloyl-ACP methyl ester carboxylesterase